MGQMRGTSKPANQAPIYTLALTWVLLGPLLVFASGYGFSFERGVMNTRRSKVGRAGRLGDGFRQQRCTSDTDDPGLFDLRPPHSSICSSHRSGFPPRHADCQPPVVGCLVVYLVAKCAQNRWVRDSSKHSYGIYVLSCGTFPSK